MNKALSFLLVLGLAALVGIMSWRDMHPKQEAAQKPGFETGYYIGKGITPEMVPDDGRPLWVARDVAPVTFAQREVTPVFYFDALPRDPARAIKGMKIVVDGWISKGNTINAVSVYGQEKVDLTDYASFVKAVSKAFRPDIALFVGIYPQWLEEAQKTALDDLYAASPRFLAIAREKEGLPVLLSRLQARAYDAILLFPAGIRSADANPGKAAALFTLDPTTPWPKDGNKIGLFPKF